MRQADRRGGVGGVQSAQTGALRGPSASSEGAGRRAPRSRNRNAQM